jgi:molecular chaperone HscB
MPAAFLMQQMAWREALEQAATLREVDALEADVETHRRTLHDGLTALLDEQRDWPAAAACITALMFMERLAQDIERRRDALTG